MSRTHSVCRHCGRHFVPDRYNQHHQEWCVRKQCVEERERARKRRYYHRRLEQEVGFRETERKRCREAMRHCRAREDSDDLDSLSDHLLVGLVSHLADTNDPHAVSQLMTAYMDRGRRLAVQRPARDSPW